MDHDKDFVLAVVQVFDDCDTREQLQDAGRRLKRETMSEKDRQYLRRVYSECWTAIALEDNEALRPLLAWSNRELTNERLVCGG